MHVKAKVIVVTGAGGGVGQQLVLQLLEKGASVAAVDINQRGLAGIQSSFNSKLTIHQADISSRDSVERLAAEVIQQHGHVDGVINNAGIIHQFIPLSELDHATIERVINVNLYGVINMTKAFLPFLKERSEAHIVNISSMGGLFAFPNQSIYGASKAGVKLITEGLFTELRGSTVGVTLVYPGALATGITKNCDAHNEKFDRLQKYFPGTPPEKAAQSIIAGMEKNRFSVVIGIDARILTILYRLFPKLTMLIVDKAMKLALSD